MIRWGPLVFVLGCLGVLKAFGLHHAPGDEGIYFYLARRMAEDGLLPYRDFFFAHPPVHLLVAAGAFKLLGADGAIAKAIPALCALGTVAVVYVACVRRLGVMAAFVAAAALATSYDFLRASSHFTGVNVTLLLATSAALLCVEGKVLAAGGLAALAASAGLYALPTALGGAVVAALGGRGQRGAGLYVAGFLGVIAVVDGGFWLAGGQNFVDQVWHYHLAKAGQPWAGWAMGRRVLIDNLGLTVGAALAVGALAWRWRSVGVPETIARLALLLGLGNLLALSSLQRAFPFYFLMMLPGLAVAAGFAAQALYEALGRLLAEEWSAVGEWAVAAGIAVVMATGAWQVRLRWHAPSVAQAAKAYAWSDAEVLPSWLNAGVRRLLWLDLREAHTHYDGVRRYLWHESRRWPLFPDILSYVADHVPPDAVLFGGSLSAPYLAFLSGRRIAADEADTNASRFRSGASDPGEVIARVQASGPLRLVIRPGVGLHRISEIRHWIDTSFRVERSWPEPRGGRFILLRAR